MAKRKTKLGKGEAAAEELPHWPETVMGGKYVRMLERELRGLRPTEAHGNRRVFLDEVVIAYLLAFFNPTIRSLRIIEDFSQTREARRHLTVRKLCKSTLSDLNRVADSGLLQPLVAQLLTAAQRKAGPAGAIEGLPDQLRQVLAVDGSFFAVAADVAWAIRRGTSSGRSKRAVRLDVHLDVRSWLPEVIDVPEASVSEAASALRHIKPGAIHLYDRGIFSFQLLEAQVEAGAYFVHRVRESGPRSIHFVAQEQRPLTDQDLQAGVQSDQVGRLAGSTHRTAPDLMLREVLITAPDQPGGQVRLLTNLLDVQAHVLAVLYRYRWQVELFFRWLKVFANFEHLISESRAGILLNFYVALLGVLLMYLHTGGRPSKYGFAMISLVARGGATLEEILPILKERERRIQLDRDRLARKRAAQKAS